MADANATVLAKAVSLLYKIHGHDVFERSLENLVPLHQDPGGWQQKHERRAGLPAHQTAARTVFATQPSQPIHARRAGGNAVAAHCGRDQMPPAVDAAHCEAGAADSVHSRPQGHETSALVL